MRNALSSRTIQSHLVPVALNIFAILIILLMVAITFQVVASWLGFNPIATFKNALPLFGTKITINSLIEFQWHLLVVVGLLPCALVWHLDRHVRVDFIYANLGPRYQAGVDLIGNLFLTLPFLALCLPASWRFMERSLLSGEVSTNGGLINRYLVKGVLPVGFGIMAIVLIIELPYLVRRLLARKSS